MCKACFIEFGSPRIINEKTVAAAALVREVYAHNHVGGGLHVILDDWNIDDEDMQRFEWKGADRDQVDAEERCLAAFKEMSVEERAAALALAEGMIAT